MEIDVSASTVVRDEPGGRDKNKRWIAEDADAPRDQHWLWKYRQWSPWAPLGPQSG